MKTLKELKLEKQILLKSIGEINNEISILEYAETLKKHGVAIGDKIECKEGKFVICDTHNYTGWLHGYSILKNGSIGSKERHIYNDADLRKI